MTSVVRGAGAEGPRGEPPPLTSAEQLTRQFYEWERRGRGWQVWDYPVELEPPYRPFIHIRPRAGQVHDDARKHTPLSAWAERLLSGFASTPQRAEEIPPADFEIPEPEAEPFSPTSDVVELHVSIPPDLKITREASEQLLLSLSYASAPLAFEIVGTPDATIVQLACRTEDLPLLREQLRAHFPEIVLTEGPDVLSRHWRQQLGRESVLVDFGLSHEFMRSLRTFRNFDVDPLTGVVGALQDLREGEIGVLQVLFHAARYPWAESIVRSVTDWEGDAFFDDAPEMVRLAQEKIERPLFATVVRVAAQSPVRGRGWQIAQALGGSLVPFTSPGSNEFIPLANDGYDNLAHGDDLLFRRTRRSGMLLNSEELVSLIHLPSASVRSEKLKREVRKTRAVPAVATGGRLFLGENVHAGQTQRVTLTPDQRTRHTYVIGASGTGKSTLLLNLIVQDIENGDGVAVLDPHGDLIDQILVHIPEKRFDDVVLLDPSDAEFPIGFNILSAHSELEKNLLASDLVSVFRRLSTSWGDQMTSVLGNAVLAFLESEAGGTLADLRRFLVEAGERKRFLATVRDPEVVYYWQKEFPLLTGKPQAPLLTRLDTFLRPKLIRYMVAQKENKLDFGGIMNDGKIFLGKLAQGTIGEENAYLLGTLLVSKFHQITMSRQEMREAERRAFYLYIDEFHNFVTPSMAQILSGARKYRLGLTLAHQDLRQIRSRDTDVLGAVIANPYTRVCFRVGDEDARKLEEGFSHFDAKDLQNLGTGEAICRMERAEYDFNLKTPPLPAVEETVARERRERIVGLCREKYGTPREIVEAVLRRAEPACAPFPEEAPTAHPPRKEEPRIAEPSNAIRSETRRAPVVEPPSAAEEILKVAREKPSLRAPAPSTPGRGGQQHKYLQELIRRWAESRGWRVSVEKKILDGLGSVDVALEKGDVSVACEISVTTTPEHELGNIQKCLTAGFAQVLVIGLDRKTLVKIEDGARCLGEEALTRLQFLTPEELFPFLEALDAQAAGKVETIRGYKVKVKYRATEPDEQRAKKQAISQVIVGALRRLKRRHE